MDHGAEREAEGQGSRRFELWKTTPAQDDKGPIFRFGIAHHVSAHQKGKGEEASRPESATKDIPHWVSTLLSQRARPPCVIADKVGWLLPGGGSGRKLGALHSWAPAQSPERPASIARTPGMGRDQHKRVAPVDSPRSIPSRFIHQPGSQRLASTAPRCCQSQSQRDAFHQGFTTAYIESRNPRVSPIAILGGRPGSQPHIGCPPRAWRWP